MTPASLRVAVLVSSGVNPVSGAPRASRNDAVALDIGRRLGGELQVIHAGDPADPALADYLAYGAGVIEILAVPAGADIIPALAERLAGFDLILTGQRAEGGQDSGLLPYLLAASLGAGVVAGALDIDVQDGAAAVTQFLPKGKRRKLAVRLPAVIALHPLAPAGLSYAFARKAAGRIVTTSTAAIRADDDWRVEPAAKRPPKLKAKSNQSGHARMLSAIVTEGAGGTVIVDGDANDKAEALLDYLRQNQLLP